ncbi:MAG TPA: GNAT family N-acetyltransferase [Anaeromyxobacteraceae bacterium]|nr:GNAT family N-acetyltransferase [Anaeromyxobacteraceae bacterium]
MDYTVRFASTPEDRELAYALRRDVFDVEQNVPRPLDRDTHDHNANHVVALDAAGRCIGTGRLVRLDARTCQIGRMAVAKEVRRHGVGKAVIEALERMAALRGIQEIVLNAMIPSVHFFESIGYAKDGEPFLDSGVPHLLMRKVLVAR